MADCKEIDAALGRLSSKIDGLNARLNNLERKQKECCNKKDDKGDNLEGLIKRVAKIETYINQLDGEIQSITNIATDIGNALKELLDIVDSFFGKVSGSIQWFTKLFNFFK
jgi:prefoldin subunit 5